MAEREWRVMRFENAEGKWAEVASNRVGPEEIPVPDGYRFVSAIPMVPAEHLRGAEERIAALEAELATMRESRDTWRAQAQREHDDHDPTGGW